MNPLKLQRIVDQIPLSEMTEEEREESSGGGPRRVASVSDGGGNQGRPGRGGGGGGDGTSVQSKCQHGTKRRVCPQPNTHM